MPFYEYRCLDCRKRFQVFLTYAEYGTRPVQCTHCGSANVQRKIGRFGLLRPWKAGWKICPIPASWKG